MPPGTELDLATNLVIAGLCGLAVGIEREWSGHASGPAARFAGARTFFLLGFLGGAAGWLYLAEATTLSAIIIAGASALTVAAYVMAARRGGDQVEGTTEAAALAVLVLGLAAGMGHLRLAAGAASVLVLALAEKSAIQGLIQRIGQKEMEAALRFAVLALVILPLLPEGPYGPYGGISPRSLWVVVLLFSGLNFLGYLARRAIGDARGYGLTGLLGGLVSSTAVTFTFSRQSRREPLLGRPLALGVLGACTVLLPRVTVVTALLNPRVAKELLLFVLPPLLAGAAMVLFLTRRTPAETGTHHDPTLQSPLQLGTAIRMTIAFQAVLMVLSFVQQVWGSTGVLTAATLLGLSDLDALTLSMTRLGQTAGLELLAAQAIAVGIMSNTLLKLTLTLTMGVGTFRRTAALGLLGLAAASALGLWLGWGG
jgi:uncharacterized membrane protein (DUF4010 family)